jgi:CRISPR-associated exonuclease Cas4
MSSHNDKPHVNEKIALFKQRFDANFKRALKKDTEDSLGDRTQYIGASDISGCLRKAFLAKKVKEKDDSIEQCLTFERGHQFENIVEKFLYDETYKKQVKIKDTYTSNGFKLKPHLDFVMYDKEKKIATVIEAKSTKNTIELYDSYVFQVQLQMGLLQAQCGDDWKVDGLVFVLSTDSKYEIFDATQNKTLFDMSMQRADILAHALKTNKEPKAEIQFYCSKCPFKGDCPAITKGTDKQLPIHIKSNVYKLKTLQKVDSEIKQLKKELLNFMEATNTDIAKSGNAIVQLCKSKNDDYGIDIGKLRIEQPEIYAKYRKPNKGFSYLKII